MQDFTQTIGNDLTIQHQTCVDEIFKCTLFVGVRRSDIFYRCSTLREISFYREQENFFAIHSPTKYKMLDKCFVEKEHKIRVQGSFNSRYPPCKNMLF